VPWETNTALTSYGFLGQPGHTYGFYSISQDMVDNREASKSVAEATTTVVAGSPQLVVTRSLSRDQSTDDIIVVAAISNTGNGPANNAKLTVAKIGVTSTTTNLPQSLGTIAAGASTLVTLHFAGSTGSPGTATTVTLSGTYDGGSFTSTARTTLP
jgi:hypothetical protein